MLCWRTPALRDTLERAELAALAQRERLVQAVRPCVKSSGVRRLCHDAVLRGLGCGGWRLRLIAPVHSCHPDVFVL